MQGRVENMWQGTECIGKISVDLGIVIRCSKHHRSRSPPRIPAGDLRGASPQDGPRRVKAREGISP